MSRRVRPHREEGGLSQSNPSTEGQKKEALVEQRPPPWNPPGRGLQIDLVHVI